jgi:NAD(P) transhydrogenase subunit beta
MTTQGYVKISVDDLKLKKIWVPLGLMVPMTAMPQRIALSHAFGGLAAALVGCAHFYLERSHMVKFDLAVIGIEIGLGFLVFTGSLMAAGKLQEWLPQRPIVYPGQNAVNGAVLGVALALVVVLVFQPSWTWIIPVIAVLTLAFGVFLIIPIGGADMPTVIALLNSYAGLSAAGLGFVLDSKLLIVAGALDGASGLILSIIMCRAMNRSFRNVLFGAFGAVDATAAAGAGQEQGTYRTATVDEAAELMKMARSVVIVPGYGMAVAQAQHKVRDLADALEKEGVEVRFAIHPVAGRMPGHMNVLLAEANVPYDHLLDMDEINGDFPQTDVVLVLGANDVVNPAARHDKGSPIYGMPILEVDKAATVFVVKRSMRAGFAGIENELFFNERTSMVFGDAKAGVTELANEVSGQRDAVGL